MKNQVQPKNKGTLKAVICFIVGLILGIAIVVGAIAGGTYYVLNSDLDGLLSMFGVDNSVDPETNQNKYVNTDPDTGGAENLLDLIGKLTAIASDPASLTLGQIDALVPATRGIVAQVTDAIKDYVEVDYAELCGVRFSEFGGYLQNKVMDIQPAVLMDNMELEGVTNTILSAVLYGLEANCVTDPSGEKHPVLVDNFTYDAASDSYRRQEDGATLISSQNIYAVKQSADNDLYDIFFFEYGGQYYIAEREPQDILTFQFTADDGHLYNLYNQDTFEYTGNYYIDASGERVVMEPITIGSLMNGDGLGALEKMRVLELLSGDTEPDELLEAILGDVSIGNLINNEVDFQEKVNMLELSAILTYDPFEDAIMLYFVDGLSNLSKEPVTGNKYSATYKLGEEDMDVLVTIENGVIVKIENAQTGEELKGTTVGNINAAVENIEITIFMDVTTQNGVLPYIAYGITGIEQDPETEEWTAHYKRRVEGGGETDEIVYLDIKSEAASDGDTVINYIRGVRTATGDKLPAAGIDELSGRVNTITDDLTIGDIVPANGNKILEQLSGSTINGLSAALNELELGAILDVPADNAVLAYLAYNITDVTVNTDSGEPTATGTYKGSLGGDDGEPTVYITLKESSDVEDGGEPRYYITGVYSDAAYTQKLPGTTIDGINDRLDGLTENLKIEDIVDTSGNKILEKLGSSTISGLSDAINELTLPDAMDIKASSAIMAYLAYGITGIDIKEGETAGTATRDDAPVTFTIDEDGNITEVKYEGGTPVEGTKINDVGIRVDGLTNDVLIRDIIKIEEGDRLMEKIGGYTINKVGDVVEVLQITDVMKIPADSAIMAYLAYGITGVDIAEGTATLHTKTEEGETTDEVTVTIDGEGNITAVTKQNGEEVESTRVQQISGRVTTLPNDLKIEDIVDTSGSKIMQKLGKYTIAGVSEGIDELELSDVMDIKADNNLMVYLGFGIRNVEYVPSSGTATGVYTDDGGAERNCTIEVDESGNITRVYYTDGGEVEVKGTTIKGINTRIDGLMNDLTIGELIGDDGESGAIFNAIKGATVNTISSTIDNITLNELYADEIYKPKDHSEGAYTAPMYKAVSGSAQDGEIVFNKNYIYYTMDAKGNYTLVNGDGERAGKLDSLPSDGEYYTHGKPTKMWQLILCDNGDEEVLKLNNIGGIITGVTVKLESASLQELSDAGILDFQHPETLQNDIPEWFKAPGDKKKFGDLTILEAIGIMTSLTSMPGSG